MADIGSSSTELVSGTSASGHNRFKVKRVDTAGGNSEGEADDSEVNDLFFKPHVRNHFWEIVTAIKIYCRKDKLIPKRSSWVNDLLRRPQMTGQIRRPYYSHRIIPT